ncbi:MAG: hypothetical protein ACRDZT_00025 [Acidimicrobiales bacterium]
MDIELTSTRDDGTFTWRAAGARQPKGSVTLELLPKGAKAGDVVRAEVEIEIDGITVVSVLPPKEKGPETGKIEFIGPQRAVAGVTTVLASKSGRSRSDHDGERRPRRADGDRRPRREGGARRPSEAGGQETRDPRSRPGPDGAPPRSTTASGGPRGSREARSGSEREPSARGARKGPVRFEPGTKHRDELFARLSPEQRPIAERLASGGLPGLRKAISEEQQRARTEGRPITSGDPLIAVAEQVHGDVKAAIWLDRAEAAVARIDEITLRDLRTTVIAAAPRDESAREIERQLREALDRRVKRLRHDWEEHLAQALDDGRVLQALRLSAKPPEPTARFPGSLVVRLAQMAGEAMTAETPPERWLALLTAALEAPVRRQIKPAGVPKDPSGEVERQARMATGRIPSLARLLGMPMPPPPKPVAGDRAARFGGRPPRSPRTTRRSTVSQVERVERPVAAEKTPETLDEG